MTLQQYNQYIRNLANSGSPDPYLNAGPEHAAIVLSNLFNIAEGYVALYAGNLNGDISKNMNYQGAIFNFLVRGGKLDILLEDYDESAPLVSNLISYQKNQGFKIKIKQHDYVVEYIETGEKVHFAVADDRAYRIEHDTDNYLAMGSFNNPEIAVPWRIDFYEMFNDPETKTIVA
ncbi:MAG TPA: hypothetical protein PKD16_18320 [Saprospiraceae bacterium]|jgi:hypothetical protein|nr:hypothetical protein [Saprospiraceae bacterium]HMT72131.1 hypothetical protein [Saprospiraceae bacterium]